MDDIEFKPKKKIIIKQSNRKLLKVNGMFKLEKIIPRKKINKLKKNSNNNNQADSSDIGQ